MPYELRPEDAASITDVEVAFSTSRLLPEWDAIPQEFVRGNLYTALAEALHFDWPLPVAEVAMRDDFAPEAVNRVVRAHLRSFQPKHEHKIAGVGLMISKMCELVANAEPAEPGARSTG